MTCGRENPLLQWWDEVAKEAYRISDIVLKNTGKQDKKRICPIFLVPR